MLADLGREEGYGDVQVLRYPGHGDGKAVAPSPLTLSGAVKVAKDAIDECERRGQSYTVLARSFGCLVALKCTIEHEAQGLDRIILWGPPPYWLMYDFWVQEFDRYRYAAAWKGLTVERSFFSSLEPVEVLLSRQRERPTVVATGADDPYAPPTFLAYLRSLCSDHNNVVFRDPIAGATHGVSADLGADVCREYRDALFRWRTPRRA